jgi:fatty-acyl-CoA synthase
VAKDNPHETGIERRQANHAALTQLSFLERAAAVWPEHTAVVHGRTGTSARTSRAPGRAQRGTRDVRYSGLRE